MRLDKEIYNLQRRRNKMQSNDVILEIMTNKMIIDLNMHSLFMKKRFVDNLNKTLVVTIHGS